MRKRIAVVQAVAAALAFGASTPVAKLLLVSTDPLVLAGLLYLGSGIAALAVQGARLALGRAAGARQRGEARLGRADVPWLAGAVAAGGVAGPILLMVGLRLTPAATASLLLNLESVATALVAALVFREAIGGRVWVSLAVLAAASTVLSLDVGGTWGLSWGALAVGGACLMWGIDNNLTRRVSAVDPLAVVTVKGLAAGSVSLALGLLLGRGLPPAGAVAAALALGAVSYGMSIALFILALRGLGAARTGALYATAPFLGAVLSLAFLREGITVQLVIALPAMVLAVALLVSERHSHEHVHAAIAHDHRHSHDDPHHAHEHEGLPAGLPGAPHAPVTHSHPHRHEPLRHDHPHAPDIHHRHGH